MKLKFHTIVVPLLVCLFAQIGSAQNLFFSYFDPPTAGVGESVFLNIEIIQNDPPTIHSIDLSALDSMTAVTGTMLMNNDTIYRTLTDKVVKDLGIWKDSDNDGFLTGEEIKWQKIIRGDTISYNNRIEFQFLDLGMYNFLGFPYDHTIFGLNERRDTSFPAQVMILPQDFGLENVDSTGLAYIKTIDRESLGVQDFLPYLVYLAIILISIFGLVKLYKHKRNKETAPIIEEKIVIPPDILALTGLKELRNKKLWQGGQIKKYQSELSRIIREYLEGRYNIKALENTTSQIVKSINDKSFDAEDQSTLTKILQISDLVKFAKAKPSINIHEEFMDDAVKFVQKTKFVAPANEEEE